MPATTLLMRAQARRVINLPQAGGLARVFTGWTMAAMNPRYRMLEEDWFCFLKMATLMTQSDWPPILAELRQAGLVIEEAPVSSGILSLPSHHDLE